MMVTVLTCYTKKKNIYIYIIKKRLASDFQGKLLIKELRITYNYHLQCIHYIPINTRWCYGSLGQSINHLCIKKYC